MTPLLIPPNIPETRSDRVVLRDISWSTYQALVVELESQSGKHLTYDRGTLEISMPLPPHERFKGWLRRIIEIATEELEIEICSLGSCTWSRKDLQKGLEADECYYIQNESRIRGKMQIIDLTVDPPPDLAIEIDISSPSLPRLPIYAALGVPEIWQCNGKQIKLLQLVQGRYVERSQSLALPSLKSEDIDRWLLEAQSMGETSWAKAVRRKVKSEQ